MAESIYELESKLAQLEQERHNMSLNVLIGEIIMVLLYPIILFLFISLIFHWVTNDTLTIIQIIKWSVSTYGALYLYIIIVCFYNNFRFNELYHHWKNVRYSIISIKEKIRVQKEMESKNI